MDSKVLLESLFNTLDIGVIFESLNKYRKRTWKSVTLGQILKITLLGKGYINITPPQATRLLEEGKKIRIIDLRESNYFNENHINGSISKPIDDFLKSLYDGTFSGDKTEDNYLLVCDTGQLSEVASSAMAEEKFEKIYNIKGGMRRWNRWIKLSQNSLFNKPNVAKVEDASSTRHQR